MTQPVLIKVYGAFSPASEKLRLGLGKICGQAIGTHTEGMPVSLSGNWLAISFEGVWFPVDDLQAFLEKYAESPLRGKIDFLDLENWRLTRLEFADGRLRKSSAPLNNVLDYSGF